MERVLLPPGPPGRPLLGHLHLLKRPLHRSLLKLAQAYGPLLFLNLGRVPTVVISSPLWAKEFLHTHDRDFSDRPSLEAGKRFFYNNKSAVLMEYGPLWRELRRLYTVQMLSLKRIEMFEAARQEEMAMAIKLLWSKEEGGMMQQQVEMRKLVFGIVGNMMTSMLFSRRLFGYGEGRRWRTCSCTRSAAAGRKESLVGSLSSSRKKESLKEGGRYGDGSCSPRCCSSAGESDVEHFGEMIEEMAVLFGAPVIGDLIPWLAWLDVGGYKQRMRRLASQLDVFLEDILTPRLRLNQDHQDNDNNNNSTAINQNKNKNNMHYNNSSSSTNINKNNNEKNSTFHKKNITDNVDNPHEDFLSLLITIYSDIEDVRKGKEYIKAILLDLLSAGTETTTTTVEWAMAELLRNPQCMSKLQEELTTFKTTKNNIKDTSQLVIIKDEDLPKLTYLQAVINETLRLHPPFPIVVRQLSKSLPNGKHIGGFHLPHQTRLLVNVWALGRDPITWGKNATAFCPERFLAPSPPDVRGQHFELLPFGSGRRGCPGLNLGLSMVGLILANLVHFFEWKLPSGYTLDVSEAPSRTAPMAKPLIATLFCKTSTAQRSQE